MSSQILEVRANIWFTYVNVEQGTRSKKQGTRSKKQGLKGRGHGERSRDQGVRSKEQGTKSIEQGARNMELVRIRTIRYESKINEAEPRD